MLQATERALFTLLHKEGWPTQLDPLVHRLIIANQEGHTAITLSEAEHAACGGLSQWIQTRPGSGLFTLGKDWLAFERHAAQEARIAHWFLSRLTAEDSVLTVDHAAALMPHADPSQHAAIQHALRHRTSLVLGGPGTGKTTTAAAIIVAHHLAFPAQTQRIALLAPTGKAAARLTQSLWRAIDAMPIAADVVSRLPTSARTIHSQLKQLSEAQLILVDEASMISVELMDQLLMQVHPTAKVIWLGDPNQLPSVEAGDVLGALANHPAVDSLRVHLTRRHRIDGNQWLGELQDLILAGDASAFLQRLTDANALISPNDPQALVEAMRKGYASYFEGWLKGEPPDGLEFQCLAAIRQGPQGIDALNQVATGLAQRAGLKGQGTRLLVTENQPHLDLYNGDIGVLVAGDTQGPRLVSFGTTHPLIDLSQISQPMIAYALSIHRSQGSEYQDVLITLPNHRALTHAQVTRELLFTAVTRAKRHVTLCAHPEDIERAMASRTSRRTTLPERLDINHHT